MARIQNYWAQQILLKSDVLSTDRVYKNKGIALKAQDCVRKLFVRAGKDDRRDRQIGRTNEPT